MTHGLIAIASAALTAYALLPATGDGGFHIGLAVIIVICAVVAGLLEGLK